jgi:hypothetical protein
VQLYSNVIYETKSDRSHSLWVSNTTRCLSSSSITGDRGDLPALPARMPWTTSASVDDGRTGRASTVSAASRLVGHSKWNVAFVPWPVLTWCGTVVLNRVRLHAAVVTFEHVVCASVCHREMWYYVNANALHSVPHKLRPFLSIYYCSVAVADSCESEAAHSDRTLHKVDLVAELRTIENLYTTNLICSRSSSADCLTSPFLDGFA